MPSRNQYLKYLKKNLHYPKNLRITMIKQEKILFKPTVKQSIEVVGKQNL